MEDDTEVSADGTKEPPIDGAFVHQTLLSVAGFLRLVQKGLQPSAAEAKELEDRVAQILPYIEPSPVRTSDDEQS